VIAGALGGRRLSAPRGERTRPTSDRVREALFSALGDVEGARVLDLYAGTGALAIEALSRGAASALLVEQAGAALRVLRENLAALGLDDRARVLGVAVERAVATVVGPFDLVLADPPYADLAAAAEALATLAPRALDPQATVVLEHATRDAAPAIAGLEHARTRQYGDTALSFYRVAPLAGAVPD
jgi:16S rRNA (guanine966-N2)-methyltransferase